MHPNSLEASWYGAAQGTGADVDGCSLLAAVDEDEVEVGEAEDHTSAAVVLC